MNECEICGAADSDSCGCTPNDQPTGIIAEEITVTESAELPLRTAYGMSVALPPQGRQRLVIERPAAPPGVNVPPDHHWDDRFGKGIPDAWDGKEVARQLAILDEARATAERQAKYKGEQLESRAAQEAARPPTVEEQFAAVVRRLATLEAQRVEHHVRLNSLEEAVAAGKPATVARIGRTPTPGSVA